MKLKELLGKADVLFNTDDLSRKKQKKCIKKLLRRLSKHEKSLHQKLQAEENTEIIEKIEKKLALTHAHREKGLKIIQEMNEEKQKIRKKQINE